MITREKLDTHIVGSIGLPILELITEVAEWRMLKRIPELVHKCIRQVFPSLGLSWQAGDEL